MTEDKKTVDLPWYRRHKTLRYRLARLLSRITKGWVRSPHYYSVIEAHRRHDDEDIERERISPDEHVRTWSLWTVEFYTPENITKLYNSLDRLEPKDPPGSDRDPGDWLRRNRPSTGSVMNLYFTPKGRRGWRTGYWCSLPEFSEHAASSLMCITPSLTLLVTYFELKGAEQLWLDAALHRDHPTSFGQNPDGSVSISSPSLEHRRLVREKRTSWLDEATAWHRINFPGLLSTHGERVSGCELSTLTGVVPLLRGEPRSHLLPALGLDWSHSVFEGPAEAEKKLFQLSRAVSNHGPPEMMYLSATEEQFRAQEIDGFGSDDGAYVARLDFTFRRTFAAAVLPRVLHFYARRTGHARDDAAAIVGSSNASKALARVRTDTAQCIDASVIARELRDAAEQGYLPGHEFQFTRRIERTGQEPLELSEVVRRQVKMGAEDLLTDVESLNASLVTQASLLSAHANLKLQPWIILLAVISMIAGLVAAIGPAKELFWPKPEKVSTSAPASNH